MPLHLLGKKSWNVYNTDNVERVRRDEAEAQAREEADELRMQEEDAERRIAILRGEQPAPVLEVVPKEDVSQGRRRRREDDAGKERKRRRLRGEDDTDRDIRYAREDAGAGSDAAKRIIKAGIPNNREDAPLQDHAGNIQLFAAPDEKQVRRVQKNEEAEAEKARKRKRQEDLVTMKFENAGGYGKSMKSGPWYASSTASNHQGEGGTDVALAEVLGKDVWGNEDPHRKERERNRIVSSDPFAAMQQAQRQLKKSEVDREEWKKERVKEMRELKRTREREHRRRRKHKDRQAEDDGLDGFSLDASTERTKARSDHDRHRKYKHRHSS